MEPAFSQRTNLLRPEEHFTIVDGRLVRRMAGRREASWPLAGLRRAQLMRHAIGGPANRSMLQLSFRGRRGVILTSHSVLGLSRFDDRTAAFKRFGRDLLDQAMALTPGVRLGRAGALSASALWWAIGALGCGAVVVTASAMASGATALGLDLGARLAFLMLVVAAAAPWVDRGAARPDAAALLAD
jgi:hypothetical protein